MPSFVLITGREYFTVTDVVTAQRKNPEILYNPCCSNLRKQYKTNLLFERQSEIVAIGTSRVLTLQKEFFKDSEKFTNAGQIFTSLKELANLEQLLKNRTKFVLIGIDPQLLNDDFVNQDIPTSVSERKIERIGNLIATYWKKIYDDIIDGRMHIDAILRNKATNNIGLVSLQSLSGFRADGSYEYGPTVWNSTHEKSVRDSINQEIDSLTKTHVSYLYGTEVSKTALDNLEKFLDFSRKNSITVIGFFPPQPHRLYSALKDQNGIRSIQEKVAKDVTTTFAKYDYKFFDLSDGNSIGAQEKEFADSIHGGSEVYKKVLIHISTRSKELSKLLAL